MTQEALKLAFKALEVVKPHYTQNRHVTEAITAIKEALREHAMREVQRLGQEIEQEPVAWMHPDGRLWTFGKGFDKSTFTIPLYTTPPQSTWVGLKDEEIADCAEQMEASDPTDSFWREFTRVIEAKLKDKNDVAQKTNS